MLVFAAAACAGRTTVEGTYRDPQGRFTVRPPSAPWLPVDLEGAALAFRLPAAPVGIGLRVDCASPESGPLPSVARHLFFGLRDWQRAEREPVVLANVAGMRTRLVARLEDAPVEIEALTFRQHACLYDFLYVASPASFAQGRPDFEAFVQSWTPSASP
jgi:hypothetical protein